MSRRALTIAKNLIKNDFINPTLRSKGGLVVAAVFTGFIAVLVVLSITSATHPSQHGVQAKEPPPIYALLARYGLSKEVITDLLSALLTALTTYGIFWGRSRCLLIKEEIYELVLSQPVSIEDVVLARILYDATFPLISMMPISTAVVSIRAVGMVGNAVKPLLLIPSASLFLIYIAVISDLGRSFRAVASGSVIKVCKVASLTYILVGLAHSLIIRGASPILATPLRPLAASLTYPLARSSTLADTSLAVVGSLSVVTACTLFTLLLSRYLSAEDFRPLEHVLAEQEVRRGRSLVPTEVKGAWGAVKTCILGTSVLSFTHVRNFLALLAATAASSLGVRYLVTEVLHAPNVLTAAPFMTTFLTPLFVGIITSSLVSWVLASDLLAYWVYRVYAVRMYEVAKALMIKYATYLTEALLVVAVIDAALTCNLTYLLMPAASLSAAVLASFLILLAITYIASKRKVIKQAPIRGHVLEDVLIMMVEAVIIASLILTKLAFDLIALSSPVVVAAYVASSVVAASLLHLVLARALSKAMETYDVAS